MLRYAKIAHQEDKVRALTGLNPAEFTDLVPAFQQTFEAAMQHQTIDGYERENRRYTTYKNSPLPTFEDKLLFILIHLKQNPTQEVQGQLFGISQSNANKWIHLLHPILNTALKNLGVSPARIAVIGDEHDGDEPAHAGDAVEQDPTAGTESTEQDHFFFMMARNGR
jgi:Helix-turn-helix of DDE superfamily endonuclease